MSKKHKQQHKRQQRRHQQKLQQLHKQQQPELQRQPELQQQQQLSSANISAVVAAQQCTGCSACVAMCPDHALSMQPNTEGFLEPVIDEAKCTHCGQCYQQCPVLKRQVAQAKLAQTAQTARAQGLTAQGTQQRNTEHAGCAQRYFALSLKPDFKALYGSSTTGIGFVLAHRFIRAGGVVVGCRFNAQTQEAEHVIARTVEEVVQFCGSKYVQSNKHEVLAQTLDLLKQGHKVLFIGTPCEVSGVTALCSAQPAEVKERLFTADLVCHGVPSPLSLKCYLYDAAAELGAIKGINFRVPHPQTKNWTQPLVVVQGEAKRLVQPAAQNHFYVAYSQSWSLRPSCYYCSYTNLNRPADLSLGDFWGIEQLVPKFPYALRGTSLIVVNSPQGVQLFNLLRNHIRYGHEVSAATVLQSNDALHDSAHEPIARQLFFTTLQQQQSTVAAVNAVLSTRQATPS